ncbi:MAG: hypothetical protein ACUZ8O_03160 [Candidatus Anammoxibacter sp.]
MTSQRNMFKERLLNNIMRVNDSCWKIAKDIAANNDTCALIIHPDTVNVTLGTLLCGAMSTISLLVFYFCN